MNCDLIWSKVLEQIQKEVNAIIYKTWFKDTRLINLENNIATIVVQNNINKKRINEHYCDLIIITILNVTGQNCELKVILEDELVSIEKEKNINKNNVNNISYQNIQPINNFKFSSNLNKNYTFDNFVVGNSNKLAHAAAVAISESPGQIYNPLFIYGSSGLGKTHLMHAIGNYIEENSDKKVLYVSSQQFIDDYTKINRKDDKNTNYDYAEYFKTKYRSIDVLIIDDIQFLATAQKSQEEFFHTFNILHDDNKQIIISSDRSPNDIKLLEERLKTRFCWGLQVDIFPPDSELRKNILLKKINSQYYSMLPEMSNEVVDYIAANMTNDVRNLEGALTRLMAYSITMGCNKIDLSTAVDALKDVINKGTSEKANIMRVQKAVADYFQISVDDLKSKKRSASIAFPRQIAMYLSRNMLNESFERIGLEFGGKDHSTVMHSCDKIKNDIESNLEIKNSIEKIKENII